MSVQRKKKVQDFFLNGEGRTAYGFETCFL